MSKKNIPELLKTIDDAEKNIAEFFGARQGWHICPLENNLDMHWMVTTYKVFWSPNPFDVDNLENGHDLYSAPAPNTERRWRRGGYSMFELNTETDGNVVWMIFDDARECKDEGLKEVADANW